jgi:aarF domain-containing kinase
MAGKRLLDAAKLLNASGNVVKQHFELRRSQLDVYSRTSTVAKAVKNQTDRVTVTAVAAYELARRFSQTEPQRQDDGSFDRRTAEYGLSGSAVKDDGNVIGNQVANQGWPAGKTSKESDGSSVKGAQHIARQAHQDSTFSPLHARELQRRSESQIPATSADSQPLAESKANNDTFSERPATVSAELSSLPRTKVPKNVASVQKSDEHVEDQNINQDVYYSSAGGVKTQSSTSKDEQDLPEGVSLEGAFASKKVSQMLREPGTEAYNPYAGRKKLPSKPLPEMVAAEEQRKRRTVAAHDERSGSEDAETQDLATAIAKDAMVRVTCPMCPVAD